MVAYRVGIRAIFSCQLSIKIQSILCCRQLSAAEHNVHNVVLYAASVLYLL